MENIGNIGNIVWVVAPLPWILGVVIKMLLGGLWYTPLVFGKIWMRLIRFRMEDLQDPAIAQAAKWGYGISLLTSLATSYIIGVIMTSLAITHASAAVLVITLMFIGFSFPTILSKHLWERRPWGLLPIDAGYEWVSSVLIGLLYMWL